MHDSQSPPILLLCPPGERIYHRDNYCSHETKASYYWYPLDLVLQSGILNTVAPIEVLDATALRLTPAEALARLGRGPYRAIFAVIGSVCWAEDIEFLRLATARTGAPLFVSGDVARAHPNRVLESCPFVTGVLMDYTSYGLAEHLAGHPTTDLCLREVPLARPSRNRDPANFSLPLPRWDLFPHGLYSLPFLRHRPYASVVASFGCRRACTFCTGAALSFKRRNLDNLFEELRFLKAGEYREIHFKDLSFGADQEFYRALLDRMTHENLGLPYSCMARVDDLQPDLVRSMKRAGCHLVQIGVETASARTLAEVNKGIETAQVRAAVEACRREGIEVLASYILGLPSESRADIENTIEFALTLGTDYAAFTPYTARAHWPPVGREGPLTDKPGYEWKETQHYAYRRFYFRPSYLLGRLGSDLTPTRLRLSLANGWELFLRHAARTEINGHRRGS